MKKLVVAFVSFAAVFFAAGNSFSAEPDKPGTPVVKPDTTPKPATDVKPDATKTPTAGTTRAEQPKPSGQTTVAPSDQSKTVAPAVEAKKSVTPTKSPRKRLVRVKKRGKWRYHARRHRHHRHYRSYASYDCPDFLFGFGDLIFGDDGGYGRRHFRGGRGRGHGHVRAARRMGGRGKRRA